MKDTPFLKSVYVSLLIVVILAVLGYFMTACNYLAQIAPDWEIVPEEPQPTDTLPLVVDTCDEYFNPTGKFCTWQMNLDFPPIEYKFYTKIMGAYYEVDYDALMNGIGATAHREYYSGINIAGIVDGFDNPSHALNTHYYMKDGFGQAYLIYFNPYLLDFNGALTPDQFYTELVDHPSFERIGFWNKSCSCDEINKKLDFIIDNCIDGTGKIIDLRNAPCQDPDRIGLLELADFDVLL